MVKSNIWAMLARAYALNGNGVRFYFFLWCNARGLSINAIELFYTYIYSLYNGANILYEPIWVHRIYKKYIYIEHGIWVYTRASKGNKIKYLRFKGVGCVFIYAEHIIWGRACGVATHMRFFCNIKCWIMTDIINIEECF